MKWTREQINEAHRIVNDIAERVDNRESVGALRRALAMSQQELAAWIAREGLRGEYRCRLRRWWELPAPKDAISKHEEGFKIRLAPGALNEWNLPHGVEPRNRDKLTPEQITEGGLYRAVMLEECDGRHKEVCEIWSPVYGKFVLAGTGCYGGYTNRVPITTPLPKPPIKESLTPQPVPDVEQSATPRTDRWEHEQECNYDVPWEENCRALETELSAALARIQELEERNTRDVVGLIQRLQEKTDREGFVNLAILPPELRALVEAEYREWLARAAEARRRSVGND